MCWETNENNAYYHFYWQAEWSDGHEWISYAIIETPFLDAFSDQNTIPHYLNNLKEFPAKISDRDWAEYAVFLDNLRDSGATNMYGAVPYLMDAFPKLRFDEPLARQVLLDWIASYSEA
ncbi:hypothetical protein SDC9_183323 [bioreactor metagenome]|uniref:Uncharacterized protein n=1 Tax=bioreactor metagenome TaxID=1076179 RepID=A0A645H9X0_9ZZZZ